jgi:two-component system chemotaxis sensor kinase CheA
VRNAVDHGIEPPAVRARVGKAPQGTVRVSAHTRGDRLVVEVGDDGAGVDLGAVRSRLATLGRAVPNDDREAARALFEPGVSTRAEATTISGRGVGLDLVRATVARIGGVVDVTWEAGAGTTVTLECPVSLATLRGVVARVSGQPVVIPTAHVARLLRVRPDDVRQAEGRSVLPSPDGPVSLVALARVLGPPLADATASEETPVVLLHAGPRRLAVAVDELLAEQEVVVRPLARRGGAMPHLAGAAILGTGQVALVLNPAAVVDSGLAGAQAAAVALAPAPVARRRPRVLVVDDSITTRTLEQSVLEAAGFDVATAVDGADGWRLLQEQGADLVVADVEMPRMDGIALCRAIRASKRFAALPVVLVTALERPEHRAQGLDAGADAYIGKSGFDQQHLLDTVRQLLD